MSTRNFELYYWPTIPGRGEFVRLLFECSRVDGIHYTDVARPDGKDATERLLPLISHEKDALGPVATELAGPFFAPPAIHDVIHDFWLSQTSAITSYLAPIVNLVPNTTHDSSLQSDKAARIQASIASRFLTLMDLSVEAHDSHHPIAMMSYYEEQKEQAFQRAADFRARRVPKYLGFFERCIRQNAQLLGSNKAAYPNYAESLAGLDEEAAAGAWFAYPRFTYADLALAFVIEGMQFAFPKCMARMSPQYPLLFACVERVSKLEKLQDYKRSNRRPALGDGLFRHYPELDDA